jgi:hypothetical protein
MLFAVPRARIALGAWLLVAGLGSRSQVARQMRVLLVRLYPITQTTAAKLQDGRVSG